MVVARVQSQALGSSIFSDLIQKAANSSLYQAALPFVGNCFAGVGIPPGSLFALTGDTRRAVKADVMGGPGGVGGQ